MVQGIIMTTALTATVVLASNPEALAKALKGVSVTVEAEFGDTLVPGSVGSLAHHGPRAGQLCPCLAPNWVFKEGVEIIGVSHADLDTLGGVLAVLGCKPEAPGFWALAAQVDERGAHRIGEMGALPEEVRRLHAWWAWSEANRLFAPRESVMDASAWFAQAGEAIRLILGGDEGLLQAGDDFRSRGEELNRSSLVRREGEEVVVRRAEAFTNHLYTTPDGAVCRAVVALNPKTGAITVSFADPLSSPSAREIVQALWGCEAGGHAGIAGSPRNSRFGEAELEAAVKATLQALR